MGHVYKYECSNSKPHGGEVIDVIRRNGNVWEVGTIERGIYYLDSKYRSRAKACSAFYAIFVDLKRHEQKRNKS